MVTISRIHVCPDERAIRRDGLDRTTGVDKYDFRNAIGVNIARGNADFEASGSRATASPLDLTLRSDAAKDVVHRPCENSWALPEINQYRCGEFSGCICFDAPQEFSIEVDAVDERISCTEDDFILAVAIDITYRRGPHGSHVRVELPRMVPGIQRKTGDTPLRISHDDTGNAPAERYSYAVEGAGLGLDVGRPDERTVV